MNKTTLNDPHMVHQFISCDRRRALLMIVLNLGLLLSACGEDDTPPSEPEPDPTKPAPQKQPYKEPQTEQEVLKALTKLVKYADVVEFQALRPASGNNNSNTDMKEGSSDEAKEAARLMLIDHIRERSLEQTKNEIKNDVARRGEKALREREKELKESVAKNKYFRLLDCYRRIIFRQLSQQ